MVQLRLKLFVKVNFFIDGRMQRIPFWPFALASVGSGVLSLLPYLAFREPNQEFSGQKDAFLRLLDSRFFEIVLSLSTVGLLSYAFAFGDWGDFCAAVPKRSLY